MKTQKCNLLVPVFLFLFIESSYSQEMGSEPGVISNEQIGQFLQETRTRVNSILKKEIYLTGVAVAIVSRETILMAEGFGYRDKLSTSRVDSNTIFGILSVSKPITVTGLYMVFGRLVRRLLSCKSLIINNHLL